MLTIAKLSQNIGQPVLRSLAIAGLAIAAIGVGVVPDITRPAPHLFDTVAQAQNVTNGEIQSYARAVLDMEPIRQSAYNDIKKIVTPNAPPNIACNAGASFSGLPGNARQIAVTYCNESRRIVRDNGLSIERFNQITSQIQGGDVDLERRIQSAMRQLQ
ncbi:MULTISPECIES: DUF4168 domain-containing protein [Spirulina sp. CCY15215]|uniref:DUF4168 domain-containing protein n=1 Tax=Spirulina sp. CCY15215 TaxID=2767591 RepID=UPI00194EB891|nr:DUF4168 domain-containing protein [Spirulina major]